MLWPELRLVNFAPTSFDATHKTPGAKSGRYDNILYHRLSSSLSLSLTLSRIGARQPRSQTQIASYLCVTLYGAAEFTTCSRHSLPNHIGAGPREPLGLVIWTRREHLASAAPASPRSKFPLVRPVARATVARLAEARESHDLMLMHD